MQRAASTPQANTAYATPSFFLSSPLVPRYNTGTQNFCANPDVIGVPFGDHPVSQATSAEQSVKKRPILYR